MRNLQNIFYDSEFEQPEGAFNIIPISYGLVTEDGHDHYYAINAEMPEGLILKREWMLSNVMEKLSPRFGNDWQDMDSIRAGISDFFARNAAQMVQVWTKNGSYDNTILCMTFGSMGAFMSLMKDIGIRRLEFRDMNELRRALKEPEAAPLGHERAHISLHDADYDRYLFHRYRDAFGKDFETLAAPRAPGIQ